MVTAAENDSSGANEEGQRHRPRDAGSPRRADPGSQRAEEQVPPGDSVQAYVAYKPFRSPEAIMPVELELPKDLPEGTYQVVFSDWLRYAADEVQGKPFRFTAERARRCSTC